MARAPRGSVPMTSGQGVSRLGYQSAYRLGGGPPPIKGPGASMGGSYGKSGSAMGAPKQQSSGIHVDYGATIDPAASPQSVAAMPGGPVPKSSLSLAPSGARPRFARQMPPIRLKRG